MAKGYRETRERSHADRERSLVEILSSAAAHDGSFPLTDPDPTPSRSVRWSAGR